MQEFYFALLSDEVKLPLYVTGVGATDPSAAALVRADTFIIRLYILQEAKGF